MADMHNRCRMIVASFLSKDLLIDWREGEKYFSQTLVDSDVSDRFHPHVKSTTDHFLFNSRRQFGSNNGGWQWAVSREPPSRGFAASGNRADRFLVVSLQASTGTDPQPYFVSTPRIS